MTMKPRPGSTNRDALNSTRSKQRLFNFLSIVRHPAGDGSCTLLQLIDFLHHAVSDLFRYPRLIVQLYHVTCSLFTYLVNIGGDFAHRPVRFYDLLQLLAEINDQLLPRQPREAERRCAIGDLLRRLGDLLRAECAVSFAEWKSLPPFGCRIDWCCRR